ncbi:hypothetical protein GCM10018790_35540 [Kitasatospora xanthocidica]|nr:hypothetical protein GCM10018790_35540 [Kitasatospora xanthocidica]
MPEVIESMRGQGRLWPGLLQSMSLTSSRPGAHRLCAASRHGKEHTGPHGTGTPQLVRALALHGVSDRPAGSHLGSTLNPGRPVLNLGVSRRRRVSGLCP